LGIWQVAGASFERDLPAGKSYQMTNDEARMPNDEMPIAVSHSEFDCTVEIEHQTASNDALIIRQIADSSLGSLSLIRQSDFVTRHSGQTVPHVLDATHDDQILVQNLSGGR
jgi:hypothetical protein